VLAALAVAGLVLFGLCWLVAAGAQDGYRLARDDESSLAAAGTAHPWLTMTGDTAMAIGIASLSFLLATLLVGRRATTGCALLALGALGVVVQAHVREDCTERIPFCSDPGASSTWHQVVHDGASGIAFLAILAAMFVLARPFRERGWIRLARISKLVGVAGALLLVLFLALSNSGAAGIAELAFLLSPVGWVAMVASRSAGARSRFRAGEPENDWPFNRPVGR
jgi:hypothetical protein